MKLLLQLFSATGRQTFRWSICHGIRWSTSPKYPTQEGKRKIKSVYLVPSASSDQTFSFEKSGRGHVIPLAIILKKGNVNFESEKLIFKISTFDFDQATKGFELAIETEVPKPEYTGKPRGRKPRVQTA